MWKDIFRCVIFFYSTFKQLQEKLDPKLIYIAYTEYFFHVLMLHWMLLLNYGITTQYQVRNFAPNQLFIQGALQQNNTIDCPYDSSNTTVVPGSNGAVSLPRMTFKLCCQLEQQPRLVDPLVPSSNCGCEIYYYFSDQYCMSSFIKESINCG